MLSSDAGNIDGTTAITVSGVLYSAVMPLEPDGTGITIVKLELI
jgi:hypothetical protein